MYRGPLTELYIMFIIKLM